MNIFKNYTDISARNSSMIIDSQKRNEKDFKNIILEYESESESSELGSFNLHKETCPGEKGKNPSVDMRIKKSNPARRKSFRARHNCKNPGPRWKARYWSCRSW
jgi:hypothetical protein